MSIQAFKIGEDREVMLPVNVNMDGFQLTHMVEPIIMPDQEEVDRFLPAYVPYATLHPDKVRLDGDLGHAGDLHRGAEGQGHGPRQLQQGRPRGLEGMGEAVRPEV